MTTTKFANGVLVKKRNPLHPDVRNPWLKKREQKDTTYQNDFGKIGTVIKTEKRDQKRKDRENPQQVFYCQVLWRGRDKTEWVLQGRLQRVEGI